MLCQLDEEFHDGHGQGFLVLFRWVLIVVTTKGLAKTEADFIVYVVSWVSKSKGLEGLRYIPDGISD